MKRFLTRAALPAVLAVAMLATSIPSSAQTTDLVESLLEQVESVPGINQLDPVLNPVSELVLGLTNTIDDVLSNVPLVNTLQLGGDDAVDAGIAFSQATYPQGAATAILAREDLFADAFSSGAFQGRFDAPLLFTDSDDLDPRTAAELQRLGMSSVAILGGENALNPLVVQKLEIAGLEVTRIGGPTRVETAIEAADATFPDASNAVLVRAYPDAGQPDSQAYADLLAAGPYATENGWPILMTTSDTLHSAVADYITKFDTVTIIGGQGAVSETVENQIAAQGITVNRIAGDNRFATAVELAEARGFDSASAADAIVIAESGARDDVWAPGFASTAFGDTQGAPVLLVSGLEIPVETMEFLALNVTDNLLDGGPAVVCASFVESIPCQVIGALMILNLDLINDLIGTLEGIPVVGDILTALGLAGLLDGGLEQLLGLIEGLGLDPTDILGALGAGDASAVTDLLEGLAGDELPLDDVIGVIGGDLPLDDVLGGLIGGGGGLLPPVDGGDGGLLPPIGGGAGGGILDPLLGGDLLKDLMTFED